MTTSPSSHRYTVPARPDQREAVAARLWAAGATGVWERSADVVGWFDAPTDDAPEGGTWEAEQERDWQAQWKATIAPVLAGPVAIVPTWLADEFERPDDVDTVVVLDPGQAFGSGHHATTTLCTEALAAMDLDGASVFDVGTGTGVLAIVAAMRGAGRGLAVDIDPEAVEVSRGNVAANGVEDLVELAVGSADATDEVFDVVVANLMTDVVAALAGDLAARVAPGGLLVVSGIDARRVDAERGPARALAGQGLVEDDRRVRDGWVGAVWSRPAG